MRTIRSLVLVLAVTALGGAGWTVLGSRPALETTFPTAEAAAAAVLDALWQRDVPRLSALAVTEREFREVVWPRLPASAPTVGMPVDYAWAETRTKSLGDLATTLAAHGGRRYRLDSVTFEGSPSDHGTFKVHRRARLRLRDADGARRELRLFGSMLESADGWKVYSYITD